jgi:DNA polymerase III sliding clamp (beta) subunit (PCNA family)
MKIERKALNACLVVAAKKDVRYYLNGVYCDPAGQLVGTDGHRVVIVRQAAIGASRRGVILPRDFCEVLAKMPTADGWLEIDVCAEGEGGAAEVILTAPNGLRATAITAKYVDWRSVVPVATDSAERVIIQAGYMADVAKSVAIFRGNSGMDKKNANCFHGVSIQQANGRHVYTSDRLCHVVMGLRNDVLDFTPFDRAGFCETVEGV